jgi:hypothetical protein
VALCGEEFEVHESAWPTVLAALITVVIFLLVAWSVSAAARSKRVAVAAPIAASNRTVAQRRAAFKGLIVGTDNRYSTSKLLAVLWTAVVVFLVIGIALHNWGHPNSFSALIGKTDSLYLVFLGGPFAGAVLAKGIVASAVASGTTQKSVAKKPQPSDLFSGDDGSPDVVDIQYLIFNFVVAVIVIGNFCTNPGLGFPHVAAFLAELTGASATTYVANKAITIAKNPPMITLVSPKVVRPNSAVRIVGQNFLFPGDEPGPEIFINSVHAVVIPSPAPTATEIVAKIPPGAGTGPALGVVINTASGLSADGHTVNVEADAMSVTSLDSATKSVDATLVITGDGFFEAGDLAWDLTPVSGAVPAVVTLLAADGSGDPPIACPLVGRPGNTQLSVTIPNGTRPTLYSIVLTRPSLTFKPSPMLTIATP